MIRICLGKLVYEGRITYEEGDLVKAVFPQQINHAIGDQANCTITDETGEEYSFEGTILANEGNELLLFKPLEEWAEGRQNRRYPRFDVQLTGWMSYPDEDEGAEIRVVNIGLGGFAFLYHQALPIKRSFTFRLNPYGHLQEATADTLIEATAEVVHIKEEAEYLHGCEITHIPEQSLHILRKYLLQRQMEKLARANSEAL